MAHALLRAASRLLSTPRHLTENFHLTRRLQHIYPEGSALFLTWHLHGSTPASLLPPPGLCPRAGVYLAEPLTESDLKGATAREANRDSDTLEGRTQASRRGTQECVRHVCLSAYGMAS